MTEFSTPWFGVIAQEGFITGDGRSLAVGSINFDALPLPLPFSAVLGADEGSGHKGSYVVGVIDSLERRPMTGEGAVAGAADIWATGRFTGVAGAFAAEMAAQACADGMRGYSVSVDLDRVSFEIRMSKDRAAKTLEEIQDMLAFFDSDWEPPTKPEDLGEVNSDESVTVYSEEAGGYYFHVTSAELRSATMVRIGAMSHGWVALGPPPTFIEVPAARDEDDTAEGMAADAEQAAAETSSEPAVLALAASSAWQPRSPWFDDPKLDGPTATVITDDGRIYGHLALHGSCHTSFRRKCVTPPKSSSAYAQFHKGSVITAEGETRAVGALVLGGSHAPLHLSADEVRKWHDDASLLAAAVRVGEDAHGIWFAGAVMPDVTEAQVARLRASGVSGHWNGQELTIIHTVNSPGFPIPQQDRVVARALAASGAPTAFVSEPVEALVAGCNCNCGTEEATAEPVEAAVETEEVVEDAPAEETPETDLAVADEPDPEVLAQLAAARALMGL